MTTKNKVLASILITLTLVILAFTLTACNNKCEHDWGKWSIVKNPTCNEEGTRSRVCSKCSEIETMPIEEKKEHIPSNDDGDCTTPITCSVCKAVTTPANPSHTGGTATCEQKAKCSICNTEYGDLAAHISNPDDGDCTTPITCSICSKITIQANATHTGGTATCKYKATCSICNKEYGDVLEHVPSADDNDCTTPITCSLCNDVLSEGNPTHVGGNATCEYKAVCDACGKEYGEFAPHIPNPDDGDCTTEVTCSVCGDVTTEANLNHVGGTATCEHKANCDVCGTIYGEFANHIPNADDGDCTTEIICSVCGDVTTEANPAHTGGTATCEYKANCEVCGTAYGEFAPHIPCADDGDCTTAITCSVCGDVTTAARPSHTGGTATCEHKANCDVCGMAYGEFAPHIPNADDGDCTTEVTCSICGDVTTVARPSHTGGTATCEYKANCEVCGTAYGEFAPHIPCADDGDCTTEVTCSVCGDVTTAANPTHIGGIAHCQQKASCEVCGMEYGEFGDHFGEPIWIKHIDTHHMVYSCCYEVITAPEDHIKVNGACTICGYNPGIVAPVVQISQTDRHFEVIFAISDNPGIIGLTATIQYNSDVMTLTDARNGEAFSMLAFSKSGELNSGCTFMWDALGITDENIKDGEFLILSFELSENAPEGEYSILLNTKAYDNDLNQVNLMISGGKVIVKNN